MLMLYSVYFFTELVICLKLCRYKVSFFTTFILSYEISIKFIEFNVFGIYVLMLPS